MDAGEGVELESQALEAALGYQFASRELLARALTHRSSVYEKTPSAAATDNEQLEFLGDAILGLRGERRLGGGASRLSGGAAVETESSPGERDRTCTPWLCGCNWAIICCWGAARK